MKTSKSLTVLPPEILLHTLVFFSPKMLACTSQTCHAMQGLSEDNSLWHELGAHNKTDFVNRLSAMEKNLRQQVLNGEVKIPTHSHG